MKALSPSFLARNMVAAIATFRFQQALLAIVGVAGPVTTQQLMDYCRYRYPPGVGLVTLRRRLAQLSKAGALRTYRLHAHASVWVLPGRPRPPKIKERRVLVTPHPPVERRRESWWVQNSREDFMRKAREQRW